jgi:pimeloyl-ACP methyl ester carboxylesterase
LAGERGWRRPSGVRRTPRALTYRVARELPSLCLWADSDPIIPLETGRALAERLGLTPPETIEDASHFLQEDRGRQIGERIAAWLKDQGV